MLWLELGLRIARGFELSIAGSLANGPPAVRMGGVPCRDRWNAFILASMLSGKPPLVPGAGMPRTLDICAVGALGLRALFNKPSGVEEGVIRALGGVEIERKEGRRGIFVASSLDGLDGDWCRGSEDVVVAGKPPEEPCPGELGTLPGGVAIVDFAQFYSCGIGRLFNSTRSTL